MRKISVAIINYNGIKTLSDSIRSLKQSKNIKVEIHVFDDCSTDNSITEVEAIFPDVKIYKQSSNTRNPNILRNLALKTIIDDIVFITDNDIIYDENCLFNLLNQFDTKESIATCSPRLMYLSERERTYFAGVKIHFIGAAIGQFRDEIVDHSNKPVESNSGGGILLVDRKKAFEVGLFDEDYGLAWGDDGEFYQRLLLAGYKCLYVPSAFGYHEYKPFTQERHYRAVGQVTNRLLFISTHYSKRTIILLLPLFLIYELLEMIFMFSKRIPYLFFKGEIEFLKKRDLIRKKRRNIQKLRRVSDKEILFSGNIYISPGLLKNKFIKLLIDSVYFLFDYYWKLIKLFI